MTSPRDDLVFVGHMLDYARKGVDAVRGRDRSGFLQDEVLQLALARVVEVIGEAARRVSKAYRDAHPSIPWDSIVGMRHRIVHDYVHINLHVVWETATRDLSSLIAQLEPLLPPELRTPPASSPRSDDDG